MSKPIQIRLDTDSAVRVLIAYVMNELAMTMTARMHGTNTVALTIEQDGCTELPQIILVADGTWHMQTRIGVDGVES